MLRRILSTLGTTHNSTLRDHLNTTYAKWKPLQMIPSHKRLTWYNLDRQYQRLPRGFSFFQNLPYGVLTSLGVTSRAYLTVSRVLGTWVSLKLATNSPFRWTSHAHTKPVMASPLNTATRTSVPVQLLPPLCILMVELCRHAWVIFVQNRDVTFSLGTSFMDRVYLLYFSDEWRWKWFNNITDLWWYSHFSLK